MCGEGRCAGGRRRLREVKGLPLDESRPCEGSLQGERVEHAQLGPTHDPRGRALRLLHLRVEGVGGWGCASSLQLVMQERGVVL